MTKRIALTLTFLLIGAFAAPPAQAGPRDRKIKKLEKQLAELERTLKSALQFRAKYRTLIANTHFLENLLRQDQRLLGRLMKYLNSPVSLLDSFLSWVKNDHKKAKKYRGVYNPPSTYLWLSCRFGLKAIKARSYYTIRVDVVDAKTGSRIYQSLGPFQRRVLKLVEKVPIQIKGLRIAGGKYKLKVTVEVGTGRTHKVLRFLYKKGTWRPRPRRPARRSRGNVRSR